MYSTIASYAATGVSITFQSLVLAIESASLVTQYQPSKDGLLTGYFLSSGGQFTLY